MKKSFAPLLILVIVAVMSAGCRQPDGQIPALDEENTNRISDLGKDLQAIARGEADGKQGFTDDLMVFADEHSPEAMDAVKGFAGRLGDLMVSSKVTEQGAQQIAHASWRLVGVTDLSDRQVKSLQDELRSQLLTSGVAQDRADNLVAEMPSVQRAVTTRPRRWYEVF